MLQKNEIILSKYRILDIIGQGGMGRVYLAVDINDQTKWAIKENLLEDYAFQLYEEADVLAKLDHPALPKTCGVMRWNNTSYMIMEHMSGETLSYKLKNQEKFPEKRVLKWFEEICDVLVYLHSQKEPIVYRDLKPSNIIIDEHDSVKIIDFGIAEHYSADSGIQSMGLTKGYAAPEQYDRRYKADVRTDIYALGVTIHYLLTGKNPIKPPYEFVPVRKLTPEISPALEWIVKKCLQPNPDKRYSDANALYYDLTHINEKSRDLKKRKAKHISVVIAALVVVACASLALESKVRSEREKQITSYYAIVEKAENCDQYSDAQALLIQAIEMQPKEITAYIENSRLILLHEGEAEFLEYVSGEILETFPECYKNIAFLSIMVEYYESIADYAGALYYHQQKCQLSPEIPEHWLDVTYCYIALEQYSNARQSIQQYLVSGGAQEVFERIVAELENIE